VPTIFSAFGRTGCALAFACVVTLAHAANEATASAGASEPEPFLPAAALMQPALLSGPDFRVVPEVRVRGYMAQFLIDTKYGPLRAESSAQLSLRVAEIPALDALDRATRSQAFATALTARGRTALAAEARRQKNAAAVAERRLGIARGRS